MSDGRDSFEILADELARMGQQIAHLQRTSLNKTEAEALKDPKIVKWLASTLRKNATREVDQKELAGLLADLDAKAQSAGAGEA